MRVMRRPAILVALVALVATGTAAANHLDPQKRIRPADQKRAKAMLVRKADVGRGFTVLQTSGADAHLTCPALDESDLTITGEAESPQLTGGIMFVASASQVYESVGDANTSWRRGTRSAGTACLREELRNEFARQSGRLQSFQEIAFPRVAQRTAAYRVVVVGESQGVTVRVVIDLVVLMHSRAQVVLYVGSALTAPTKTEEVRLARTIAKRMAAAMRGS
jgi:hypothetical protein